MRAIGSSERGEDRTTNWKWNMVPVWQFMALHREPGSWISPDLV